MNVIKINDANVFLGRKQILHGINITVKEGAHTFILGPNGAGKTTLTRMLLGYIWPSYGASVEVLGNVYGKCDIFEVRKRISWISPYLSNWIGKGQWNVIETVLSGKDSTIGLYKKCSKEDISKAESILDRLGILKFKERQFGTLSSGEQIKVLIGKALFSEAGIMILDEACVHLDIKSRENFLETVDELCRSIKTLTIIFITQRIEDISSAFDTGVIIKNGRIADSGAKKDILTEERLSDVFDINMKLVKTENGRFWPIV